MKQGKYIVRDNVEIARGIFRMVLEGDTSAIGAAGQFVNIRLEGCYLRRPISIADWDGETVTLLYKVVGKGTDKMSKLAAGSVLDILTGLGNGFSMAGCRKPLLVGGGIGLAPLYGLAKRLVKDVDELTVVAGAARKEELFYLDEFRAIGANVVVSTDDGSEGVKGFVTDAIREKNVDCDYFFTCGPMPMMKALMKALPEGMPGQLSLEERMGCGFGACVGCSIQTNEGVKRVCKDGPVFYRTEFGVNSEK